jgi:ubiquitin C-terminal hydrolase
MGFASVPVSESGEDTLLNALWRASNSHVAELKCDNCSKVRIFERIRVAGAPEILRIKLNVVLPWDQNLGDMPKNRTPITIPMRIDLADLEQKKQPLRYRLSSVLSHHGNSMFAGHWVATVHGPRHVYAINDDCCVLEQDSFLNSNPQRLHDPPSNVLKTSRGRPSKYEAVALTYVRVHGGYPKRMVSELF